MSEKQREHYEKVEYQDSVSKANQIEGQYDVILANPPFTGTVNESTINQNLLDVCNTKKTELLFVALFIQNWLSL